MYYVPLYSNNKEKCIFLLDYLIENGIKINPGLQEEFRFFVESSPCIEMNNKPVLEISESPARLDIAVTGFGRFGDYVGVYRSKGRVLLIGKVGKTVKDFREAWRRHIRGIGEAPLKKEVVQPTPDEIEHERMKEFFFTSAHDRDGPPSW